MYLELGSFISSLYVLSFRIQDTCLSKFGRFNKGFQFSINDCFIHFLAVVGLSRVLWNPGRLHGSNQWVKLVVRPGLLGSGFTSIIQCRPKAM